MKKILIALLFTCAVGHAATKQYHSAGGIKISDIVYAPGSSTGLISTSSPIIPTSSFLNLMSTGSNIILRARPTLSTTTTFGGSQAIPNGYYVLLASTATISYTLQDNSVLSGSLMNLAGDSGTRVVSSTTSIGFIFNGATGQWVQVR